MKKKTLTTSTRDAKARTGASKPSGKRSLRNTLWEKLPAVWPIATTLIPSVKRFAIGDVFVGKPFVVIRTVTYPSDQKLPTAPTLMGVDNVLNEELLKPIRGEYWSRLGLCVTREQRIVVRAPPRLEFGGVKNRVSMRLDVQGVGGCGWMAVGNTIWAVPSFSSSDLRGQHHQVVYLKVRHRCVVL
jgi:hypothetical protein